MSELPVREIVQYKHGVGYFLREGNLNATEIELTFRRDDINDVLKSLTVLDRAGGQVLGIHYQTPMNIHERLATSSIQLSDDESLHNLIRDLRGRQVLLTVESTPGTVETITGRVIGLDKIGDDPIQVDAPRAKDYLSVLTESAQVRIIPFVALRSFDILDEQSAHDMRYF